MQKSLNAKITATDIANFLGVTVQNIHKILKQKNLPSQKSQNRVYFGHKTAKELLNISFDKKVISFQIVKGGVGKTSISHSFAIRANLYGAKVLCIDLDQQGNLTSAFNYNPDESPVMIDLLQENMEIDDCIVNISDGLDLLPSRIENATLDNLIMLQKHPLDRLYKNLIEKVKHKYDLIIFDCPPALGQSVATATLASDIVLATVTPEQFSLNALDITCEEIKNLNKSFEKDIEIKILINKFDNRNVLSSEVLYNLLNKTNIKKSLCRSFIRICQEFPNTIYDKSNIFNSLKNTSAKEDIDLFTRELLEIGKNIEVEKVA